MATLYITEFASMGVAGGGAPQIAAMPPVAEQAIAIGAETDSAAFNGQTKFVRLHPDAACSIVIGSGNPAATTLKMRLPANAIEYFGVQPGQVLSVIANT